MNLVTHLAVHLVIHQLSFVREQHPTWGRIKSCESFWTLEDTELHITMTKLDKGKPWDAALEGHEPLDPVTLQEVGFY